jgi:hypothetical protein
VERDEALNRTPAVSGAEGSNAMSKHREGIKPKNTWIAPPEYVELARQVMGCIDDRNVFMTLISTGTPVRVLMADVIERYQKSEIDAAILLTFNSTDTRWFRRGCAARAVVCFKRHRIRFLDEHGNKQNSPVHGQMFFYFGKDRQRFAEVFREVGWIGEPHWDLKYER